MYDSEGQFWKRADPDTLWLMDKLILSRKLGYVCGPVGQNVPKPDHYIVRPCVNIIGLGLGASKMWLDKHTYDLPLGYFWCEFFEGRHLSVDYHYGKQVLCVEGFKKEDTFTKWNRWVKTEDEIPFPSILEEYKHITYINCEFIDGKLIEVHFRSNPDFDEYTKVFIPVWEGQSTYPPPGFRYIKYRDIHGRIGAFIKDT